MSITVLVLNGPNLNLLGSREPDVYGARTLEDILVELRNEATPRRVSIEDFQSNHEGELIERLHRARGQVDGVIFNPGGYTHTSVALRDAISAVELPVIETHLTNVAAREPFRHQSLLAPVCVGVVSGFGHHSYAVALEALIRHLDR